MKTKLTSRKFLISVAAFLGSFGTGITGLATGNQTLAMAGGACMVLSAAIYAGCEAYVDAAAAGIDTTSGNVTKITTEYADGTTMTSTFESEDDK